MQVFYLFDIHMSVHRNIIPNYGQQDATFLDLFIFTNALHVSGGPSAHHQEHTCTYRFRYCHPILLLAATLEETELKMYVQLCAPDDGRRNRLKHVERL
jgi:hypothetical protein